MRKILALLLALAATPAAAQNTFFAASPGQMIYRGASGWSAVTAPSSSGQFLISQGPTAMPIWTFDLSALPSTAYTWPQIPTNRVMGNATGGQASFTAITVNQVLDMVGYDVIRPPTPGSMIYKDASTGTWQELAAGPAGFVITSQGINQNPVYSFIAGVATPGVTGTCLESNGVGVAATYRGCLNTDNFAVTSPIVWSQDGTTLKSTISCATCAISGSINANSLIGTTLAANVVNSSLTAVGTLITGVWNATTIAIANGGTGATTAAGARASPNLNIERFTGVGNTNYTILSTDKTVGTNAAFTAARTWTLPLAAAVNDGQMLVVSDFQGTITATNTLTLTRAGSNTINGSTSVTLNTANSAYALWSDGSSKWTAQVLGAASGLSSLNAKTGALTLLVTVQTFCPSGCTTTIAGGGSGTYTPTSGTIYSDLGCYGGGGGGGGVGAPGAGSLVGASGGGGGAGSKSERTSTIATIGASQTVNIGAAGAAGATGANNGGNGGDSSIGSLVVGKGATGGVGWSTATASGGAGGVAGTGTITGTGQSGFGTFALTGSHSMSGAGGSTDIGGGGIGVTSVGGPTTGAAATGPGGGGSGGAAFNTASTGAGGAGFTGYCYAKDYVLN